MPTKTFLVPKNHVLEDVLGFSKELAFYTGKSSDFAFDFQGKGLDTPFGLLFISFAIKEFINRHPNANCSPVNFESRWYASHMGYFQSCGFDIGKLPGQAQGSDTYLPITIMLVSDIQEQAKQKTREVGDIIEDYSTKLSRILAQQDEGPLVDLLSYAFREMIRNIVEHSNSDTIALCAQYRQKAKQAEIAILDTGIGIRASLSNNPYLEIKDDHDAFNLALMPGISGKTFKGVKRNPYDVWQNSGYGLFVVSRLCGHGGKFTICSGETALSLKPDTKKYHHTTFQGTALRIILSTKEIINTKSTLSKIMKEGDKQAKQLGTSDTQASAASKMLSSEFTKKNN